jgi:DNA-binding FrmR family transcriptional regulator
MVGYTGHKLAVQGRLERIEGQVRGISRMVDDDRYCIDVLTQMAAATKALPAVAVELLGDHLTHCVQGAVVEGGSAADTKLQEAQAAVARLVK